MFQLHKFVTGATLLQQPPPNRKKYGFNPTTNRKIIKMAFSPSLVDLNGIAPSVITSNVVDRGFDSQSGQTLTKEKNIWYLLVLCILSMPKALRR